MCCGIRACASASPSGTVAECCRVHEQNTELHISILDNRFLCGDKPLFESLADSLSTFYRRHGSAIVRGLAEITRARHAKYNNTIYHLEPNIKETPGAIRDIHLLGWLSGLMPQQEAIRESLAETQDAKNFLYELRFFLHERAHRDNNLLTFELQDEAAESLGNGAAPDEWMRSYYQKARKIWQAAWRALEHVDSLDKSLLRHFRDRRSRYSNADFSVLNYRVFLRNAAEISQKADSVLALFTFVARHGIRLAWDTQRRLRSQSETIARQFASEPASWALWSELLSQRHTSLALQEMHEADLLSAAIPSGRQSTAWWCGISITATPSMSIRWWPSKSRMHCWLAERARNNASRNWCAKWMTSQCCAWPCCCTIWAKALSPASM